MSGFRRLSVRLPSSRLLIIVFVLTQMACSAAHRPAEVEVIELPAYTPEESSLFNDEFDEAALHGGAWSPDALFAERVRRADGVQAARIQTAGENPATKFGETITVQLTPIGNALAGQGRTDPLELVLPRSNPSYRLFRWQLGLVLGKDVVLFYRRYTQDGETRVHFRAEPNDTQVYAAVQQALLAPAPQ